MREQKIKTCFGSPLLDEMHFSTFGGTDVHIRFIITTGKNDVYEEVLRIRAEVNYTCNDDLVCLEIEESESFRAITHNRYPEHLIKGLQKHIVNEILDDIFDKESK